MKPNTLVLCAALALSACGGASASQPTPPVTAQTTVTDGLHVTGVVPGTSANLIIEGTSDVLVGLDRTGPANTTAEGAFYMRARDGGGTMRKTWSLSNKWVTDAAENGYSVTRFNTAYMFNGEQIDDLSIRQFGGRGITLFGNSDTDVPPPGVSLLVRGTVRIGAQAQVYQAGIAYGSPQPAADPAYGVIFIGADGQPRIKMPNGSVFRFALVAE